MLSFKHVVLTRFNLNRSDKPFTQHITDAWMQSRIDLFTQYTVASFKAQTTTDYEWWILISDHTRDKNKDRLRDILDDLDHARLVQMKHGDPVEERLHGVDDQYLLTTRVDNDDVLHPEFIETIQSNLQAGKNRYSLNLPYGVVYEEQPSGLRKPLLKAGLLRQSAIITRQPSNPFVTLVENLDEHNPKTVLSANHLNIGKHGPVKQVGDDKPYWMQVVHGDNVRNHENLRIHWLLRHYWHQRTVTIPPYFHDFIQR